MYLGKLDSRSTYNEFVSLQFKGLGQRESVRRFAEAAGEINVWLRIYEAVTADEDVDLDKLPSVAGTLLPKELKQRDRREGKERSWLYGVLGRMVQTHLYEHCYPKFTTYTRGGFANGRFALSWGFKSLLGAIWLLMARLLEAEGEHVTRCKLPDCLRMIHFEPGEPPPDPGLKKNPRGRYKTRSDREFCKGRPCKQKYHYRKKAGWPGYDCHAAFIKRHGSRGRSFRKHTFCRLTLPKKFTCSVPYTDEILEKYRKLRWKSFSA